MGNPPDGGLRRQQPPTREIWKGETRWRGYISRHPCYSGARSGHASGGGSHSIPWCLLHYLAPRLGGESAGRLPCMCTGSPRGNSNGKIPILSSLPRLGGSTCRPAATSCTKAANLDLWRHPLRWRRYNKEGTGPQSVNLCQTQSTELL